MQTRRYKDFGWLAALTVLAFSFSAGCSSESATPPDDAGGSGGAGAGGAHPSAGSGFGGSSVAGSTGTAGGGASSGGTAGSVGSAGNAGSLAAGSGGAAAGGSAGSAGTSGAATGGSAGASAGSGGANAGSGGANAGSGGANAGSGGASAGSGGASAGSGGASAGSGGAGGGSCVSPVVGSGVVVSPWDFNDAASINDWLVLNDVGKPVGTKSFSASVGRSCAGSLGFSIPFTAYSGTSNGVQANFTKDWTGRTKLHISVKFDDPGIGNLSYMNAMQLWVQSNGYAIFSSNYYGDLTAYADFKWHELVLDLTQTPAVMLSDVHSIGVQLAVRNAKPANGPDAPLTTVIHLDDVWLE